MKKTNDKHKGRRIVQTVLCLCLAAAMVIGFVPETLSVFSVQAEEAQVSNEAQNNDGLSEGTAVGNANEGTTTDETAGGTADNGSAGSTETVGDSKENTTTAENADAKNLKVLTADNSSQRKEQTESKKELSPFVSAKITAKTDFAEGDMAKVSVATEDSLSKLQIELDKYLAKENKELSKINLPLEIGYVNAEGVAQEKKEDVTVKLTFEDDTVYEDLKTLDKEGKLSLYHQKKAEDSTTTWETLSYKFVDKTETEEAHIEFTTKSFSPFFFVQTKEKETNKTADNALSTNTFEAEGGAVLNDTTISIDRYEIGFSEGATKTDGKYVWTTSSNSSGHTFIYNLNYVISGDEITDKGALKFTLPLHVFKDRDGNWADTFDCPYILDSELYESDEPDFTYSIDSANNTVTIYNYTSLNGGTSGYIEVSYTTTKTAINYVDMAEHTFKSTMSATGSKGGSAQKSAEGDSVYINTSATLSSASIKNIYSTELITSWQSSWGSKPSDADNYYYLIWTIQSTVNNNQPYNLKIEDTFSDLGGNVVGYKFAGQSQFTSSNEVTNIRTSNSNSTRYDYVLTRYEKSKADEMLDENGYHSVTNKAKITLTPYDGIDAATSASASQTYRYTEPVPYVPTPVVITYEKPTSYFSNYKDANWYKRYTLGDLVDKTITSIDNLSYSVSMTAYPYPYTLADGATGTEEDANAGKYGQKSVDYVLTDDELYLGSSSNKLNDDDYDITSVNFSISMKTAAYNTEKKRFVQENITDYKDTDKVTLWVRTGTDTWQSAAVWDMASGTYSSLDESLITKYTGKSITFAEGIKGVRLTCSNAYYYTYLYMKPSISLKGTENVLKIVGDSSSIGLINYSNAKAMQNEKNIFSRSYSDTGYIVKVTPHSSITKQVTGTKNDKRTSTYYTTWRVTAYEYYIDDRGTSNIEQESGTFYDLLPNGAQIDFSTVAVTASGKTLDEGKYTVSQSPNYKDTGRTLVTVKINESTNSKYTVTYTTVHAYEAIQDYGKSLLNSVAYETGNDKIADGFADDGGSITDKSVMSDLDESTEANKFIYAEQRHYIDILMGQYAGLTKQIKAGSDTKYGKEIYVSKGDSYSYKIRVGNNKLDRSKDLIFFDSIENYYQTADQTTQTKTSDWKGTLTDIDLSVLRQSGAEPVVYLSAVSSLNVAAHHDLSEKDSSGNSIWLEQSAFVANYGSIGKATAIAVDASKKADGTDFILEAGKAIRITLYMTAPESDTSGQADPRTYNNAFLSLGRITSEGDEQEVTASFVRHDYTTAHYRISGTVNLKKVDETNTENTIKSAGYLLRGTSDYGTEYNEVRTSGEDGSFSFTGIEKGTYELMETSCSNDWLLDTNVYTVKITENGQPQIEDFEKDEDGCFLAMDAPRIHADLTFKKTDSIDTSKGLNGVQFVLTGTSDYGTDVFMQAESSGMFGTVEAGEVEFSDIELGTYKLSETKTIEGYILSQTEWTVKVDERGVAVIRNADGDETGKGTDGIYRIENEPLHSIRFVKTSTYGDNITLEGAKFSLTGVSDYGTNTNATATSGADGIVVIEGLEPGTYQLKETKAPEDHELNTTAYKVTVSKDGGFTIEGLNTIKIGSAVLYDFKDVKSTGTIKLTKVWKDDSTNSERTVPDMSISTKKPSKNPNGYTITFDAKGGSFTIDGKSVTTNDIVYSESKTILIGEYYTPASDDGAFVGWYTDEAFTKQYTNLGTAGAITTPLTEDVTVYAKFAKMKYAVSVYDIGVDTLSEGTAGLTFGPAWGKSYTTTYASHTPSGTTDSGNAKRCIHNDSWSTIIDWNTKDPYVYQDCISNGCTHSVELSKNNTTSILNSSFDASGITAGDGPSGLLLELYQGSSTNNLKWNLTNTNSGGWGASNIRAMLNGADTLSPSSASGYTFSNCLFATFPDELQAAIGSRAVKYDSVYNSKSDANLKTTYDKLWLLSSNEIGDTASEEWLAHPNEGSVYARLVGTGDAAGNYSSKRVAYTLSASGGSKTSSSNYIWLRTLNYGYSDRILMIKNGKVNGWHASNSYAICPCFTLKR